MVPELLVAVFSALTARAGLDRRHHYTAAASRHLPGGRSMLAAVPRPVCATRQSSRLMRSHQPRRAPENSQRPTHDTAHRLEPRWVEEHTGLARLTAGARTDRIRLVIAARATWSWWWPPS